jgi:hypothetical protein
MVMRWRTSFDLRPQLGLVVHEDPARGGRDLREAGEAGTGAFAGAPRDDDCSDAHRRRV